MKQSSDPDVTDTPATRPVVACSELVRGILREWEAEADLLKSGKHPRRQGLPRCQVLQEECSLRGCIADIKRVMDASNSYSTAGGRCAPPACSVTPNQPAHILRKAIQAMEQEQYDDYCEYVRMCGGTPISKIQASRPVTPNAEVSDVRGAGSLH